MSWLVEHWIFRDFVLPALDVLIVAYLIYMLYLIIAETRAIPALKGIFLILLTTVIANLFRLETLGWLLEKFLGVAAIALIVLFQPELRRILMKMGQDKWLIPETEEHGGVLTEVSNAVEIFSERRTGALIAFERSVGLKNYIETGTRVDGMVSYELLMTIFSKQTPLHDGAVIIEHDRLAAAGCFLPLSDRRDIRRSLGTRHRAALGLSEESDAAILVVSEETGVISLAVDGKIRANIKPEKVMETLQKLLLLGRRRRRWPFFRRRRAR